MNVVRYVLATAAFLIVGLPAAYLLALDSVTILPNPDNGKPEWQFIPGLILGLCVGVWAFRACLRRIPPS